MRFDEIARLASGETRDRIVGIVDPRVAHLIGVAAGPHVRSNKLANAVTLIVEETAAPMDDRGLGLEVTSFLASGPVAEHLERFVAPLDLWCFRLMQHLLAQDSVTCELRIVHKPKSAPTQTSTTTCDVVLPHRGPDAYLRLSADSLLRQTHPVDILVAIDQPDVDPALRAHFAAQTRVALFGLSPCPVGPYVARHVLATRSHADAVAFQDSDDLSLPHRLATLAAAAALHGAGMVGSHELQVHEPQRKVYAIRYPLDVNAALRRSGANHQLMLPTSLVRRDVFDRTGGFSTFRTFSLDVAFWLAASFTTRIVNVDEFLYVRRRHPTSLTMRPDIGTDSALRREIVAKRLADFAAIRDGRLSLADSSLAIRHRETPVRFTDLKTGEAMTWLDTEHSS